jgi:hypothetical protein
VTLAARVLIGLGYQQALVVMAAVGVCYSGVALRRPLDGDGEVEPMSRLPVFYVPVLCLYLFRQIRLGRKDALHR